ncbi:DUF7344 domain-containing protein [Natrinema soli]|uniref:DUF7344 domain-containing protein n=1 Tax=Natrinema soli TaxID=1930624 RepID=A0ABD5SYL9_9EURY|nr:hypothetical protein [Natrinema soli]
MDTGVDDADFDALYGLLSDSYRRYVLYYLLDSEYANVDGVSLQIAGWEQDIPIENVSEDALNTVTLSLVHNHLPRLVDHGLVNYDRRSGDIIVGDRFDAIRSTVEQARAVEEPDITINNSTESFLYSELLTERDDQSPT